MKILYLSIIAIFLFALTEISSPSFAHNVTIGVQSTMLRINDHDSPSTLLVKNGEQLQMQGKIESMIFPKSMNISLMLKSNGTEGRDWALLDARPVPGSTFTIPPHGIIPYDFEIRFLKPGVFHIKPFSKILSIQNGSKISFPLDANSSVFRLCGKRNYLHSY